MKKGFVASSFDLIHPGYILMFQDAKTVCDYLICGLHTDPTIDRPTKNKPIQSLEERKIVLQAIRYVDEIVLYNTESELYELLKTIKPDVRILGTDYAGKRFTGDDLGINIHWHKRNHDWSTTNLKRRIQGVNLI
jgi:glycerol-3-phosphate cytidylyltransferase